IRPCLLSRVAAVDRRAEGCSAHGRDVWAARGVVRPGIAAACGRSWSTPRAVVSTGKEVVVAGNGVGGEDGLCGYLPGARGRPLAAAPAIRDLPIVVAVGSSEIEGIEQPLIRGVAAAVGRLLVVVDRCAWCHAARALDIEPSL